MSNIRDLVILPMRRRSMRIRLIRQLDDDGCGIACLAMVTGRTYQIIKGIVSRRKAALGVRSLLTRHKDLESVLRREGLRSQRVWFRGWRSIDSLAMVPVNRCEDRTFHWVVFVNGRKRAQVLDPYRKHQGRRYNFRGLKSRGYYIAIARSGCQGRAERTTRRSGER